MVHVEGLYAYPVKSLDGVARDRVRLAEDGPLVGDRVYGILEADADIDEASVSAGGGYVNGKSEPAIHRLRATYETVDSADPTGAADATATAITLSSPHREPRTFSLPGEIDSLEAWLTEYFGYDVRVVRDESGFPDDTTATGPTVVSNATLQEVASWFDGVDSEGMRRRLRPNVVVGDCPAFWEDRLVADRGEHVGFRVGDSEIEGVSPCARCAVPGRDPDTGAEFPDFRETFIRNRRLTKPEWLDSDRYDHDFRLMVNTLVPQDSWGDEISVGDDVVIQGTAAVDDA